MTKEYFSSPLAKFSKTAEECKKQIKEGNTETENKKEKDTKIDMMEFIQQTHEFLPMKKKKQDRKGSCKCNII